MSIFQQARQGVQDWFNPGEMTYEEMLRRRQVAQTAQTRQRDLSAPGAGLGALADAFVGKIAGGQADAATTKGREGASSALGALLQGRVGGGGMSAPQMNLMQPQQANPGPQAAPDGSIQRGGMADTIRQGLTHRGLPPHVADAFVMNMQDESGLNPGINEAKPLVPGSRGGFGLAQWTGPRRRQLEQFAAQQGKPVSDPDVQMDFLVSELQGSERGAAQAILSAPDTGSAAAAIVNKFLRPAEEHRARRVAQYTGGQQSDAMSFAGGSEPNVQFTSQMGGGEGIDPRLAELMQNPYVAELPQAQQSALGALFQQQLGAQDPMSQAQLAKIRAETAVLQAKEAPKPIEVGGVLLDPTTYQPIYDSRQQDDPSSVREYEYYVQQARARGEQPMPYETFSVEKARAGASNVTVNNGGDKFNEEFAKTDATALAAMSEAGIAAQRNLGRIDQLEGLLNESPSGFAAAAAMRAGEWGINTEGLDTLQAAQAAINAMVPEQRQPGSGPMSDADLDLFKQSLPRIINQPGGNQLIINTLRGVAQYDAEGARIAQAVRSGEMSRDQAFEALQNRTNPLEQFRAPPSPVTAPPPPPESVMQPVDPVQSTAPVQISSPEQYQALPSGAEFIAPDGTVRRKP